MKKIVALMVALMMLIASAACAESIIIADPVITLNMGGEQVIDLTGLQLSIATGEANGNPALQIDVSGNGSKLMGISANVTGEALVFAVDGVSGTYCVPLEAIMSQMNVSTNMDLSSLDIDVNALMTAIQNGVEFDGTNFRVPYTTVNEVLEIVAPAMASIEIPGVDMAEFTDGVAQLKESNSGITLEGSFAQDGDNMSAALNLIPVQNGEAGAAAMTMNADMGDNGISVVVDIPGQANLYLKAAPTESGTVAVSVGGNASGMSFDFSCIVGASDADVAFQALDAANAQNVLELTEAQQQQLLGELQGAVGGLIGYVMGALGGMSNAA